MADAGPCEYCKRPGVRRAGPEDGLQGEAFACKPCWELLKNPLTAVPLLRGHVSLEMRGVVEEREAEKLVQAFVGTVSGLSPRRRPS